MGEYTLSGMLTRIKKIKKDKKITNEMLSKMTDISLGTLSKILAGVTKEPSVETIIKIAHALDTSADYLIFGSVSSYSEIPQIFTKYEKLNSLGKQKADEYIMDLSESKKYIEQHAALSDDISEELKQDVPTILIDTK